MAEKQKLLNTTSPLRECMDVYEALDLTEGERKVYASLVKLGSSTTGPIYKNSNVSQSKVYEILARLKEKGLASSIAKENILYWQPTDARIYLEKISRDLEEIKEKKKILERELPNLTKSSSTNQENVTVVEGFNGFRNTMLSFQESFKKGDELLVFSSPKAIPEPYMTYLLAFTDERVRRKTNARVIYGADMKNFVSKLHGNKKTEIKFVNIVTPSTIGIGPDKVIFMNWIEKPKFIVLTGDEIVKSYHNFFESFWKMSNK